ncbi:MULTISPECIES: hypothetical protein [unclassified Kaistella]|uniref:hypothetical protein n=1 Tax=unclassified Kaistella TaxID=2762626 RepID=UPI0027339475|nr:MULTISPECIES: hypothetical protein [unclassified Kaistella]MCZ2084991.1 hypothetical protein [Flavobacteriales bacterium]MDP2453726.1 hypothetical protein [Kaistella sp. SH11-4b]MDP2456783.1 hypothetical protein [Kaistella sp. SH40-3]MDP2459539.1 hypothetical protein [Kaistella sp. SH19-2b]
MQRFYKIFLVLFIVFIAINLYVIEWDLGFWDEENSKFIFSMSAGILGIIVVLVMHTMSRLSVKK